MTRKEEEMEDDKEGRGDGGWRMIKGRGDGGWKEEEMEDDKEGRGDGG